MRIRLHNTAEENAAALAALENALEILDDSGDRVPRNGGLLRYRYLTVRLRPAQDTETPTV